MRGYGRRNHVCERRRQRVSTLFIFPVHVLQHGHARSLCLWTTQKKKPQFTQSLAHGLHEVQSETEGVISTARWITSVACLRYADLVASGACISTHLLLYTLNIHQVPGRVTSDYGSSTRSSARSRSSGLPAPGFVNSLQFVLPPRGALSDCAWASRGRTNEGDGEAGGQQGKGECVLLVAGMGQEP